MSDEKNLFPFKPVTSKEFSPILCKVAKHIVVFEYYLKSKLNISYYLNYFCY